MKINTYKPLIGTTKQLHFTMGIIDFAYNVNVRRQCYKKELRLKSLHMPTFVRDRIAANFTRMRIFILIE